MRISDWSSDVCSSDLSVYSARCKGTPIQRKRKGDVMTNSAPQTKGGKLSRDARIIGLLFASTTSMIGSGWLFGAYHASMIAGPLSVWSWIIGAVIIMLIALCFAELSALFPRCGALLPLSHACHCEGVGGLG